MDNRQPITDNQQPKAAPRKPLSKSMRLLVSLAIIAVGLAITAFFGIRAVRSFRELQYIHQQGLDRGTASLDAIRPWMTIRFIAVAYTVPEEYLYAQLNIPFERRNADRPLGRLNDDYNLGQGANGRDPAIMDKVKTAITEYRKNPVATGLSDVRPWMSIRYIANSTGVPEQTIFDAIKVPAEGNQFKPLDLIVKEQHYPGGPPALIDAVRQAIGKPTGQPPRGEP